MNLNYAGIGCRALQDADRDLVIRCARYLTSKGYVVHSGAAEGTDQLFSTTALEAGEVIKCINFKGRKDHFEFS